MPDEDGRVGQDDGTGRDRTAPDIDRGPAPFHPARPRMWLAANASMTDRTATLESWADAMADERSVLRIGEVSRRTGVAVPTLRAWERRYGLLDPARTDGGHRLYSEVDVLRVRSMSRLLDDGWSAAAGAREVVRGPAGLTRLRSVEGNADAASDLAERLHGAIDAFDASAADEVVDDVFARLEVPRALDEVLLPVLRRIGDGWQEDPRVIAREHFATNTLRPRLQRLLRASRTGDRSCLAVAPEGEDHDLGLLSGAAVAAVAGWRTHYLGARTPTVAIVQGARELAPDVLLIGAVSRQHAEAFLEDGPKLARPTGVVLGGAGFEPADAQRLRHAVVHQGPIRDVPATMDRALAARGRVS